MALAQARRGMAQLIDDASYSHYRLRSGSLAGTPEAVAAYLRSARLQHADAAAKEFASLERFARDVGWLAPTQHLRIWDRAPVQAGYVAHRLEKRGLGRGWGGSSDANVTVPLDVALHTLFDVAHAMLGVRFERSRHSATCDAQLPPRSVPTLKFNCRPCTCQNDPIGMQGGVGA